jgi:hypothetical protein
MKPVPSWDALALVRRGRVEALSSLSLGQHYDVSVTFLNENAKIR